MPKSAKPSPGAGFRKGAEAWTAKKRREGKTLHGHKSEASVWAGMAGSVAGTRGRNAPGIPWKCLRYDSRHGNVISAAITPWRCGVGNTSKVLEAKSITPRLKLPKVKLEITQILSSDQFTLQEVTGRKFRNFFTPME